MLTGAGGSFNENKLSVPDMPRHNPLMNMIRFFWFIFFSNVTLRGSNKQSTANTVSTCAVLNSTAPILQGRAYFDPALNIDF